MAVADQQPVLWHLKVSNYNEKARWALDFKGIQHVRKALEPGRHRRVAQGLAGIDTLPVLELDGKAIGDSTQIISALEDLKPDPPLYPAGDAERRRALELEDYFDEELGPHARILAVSHALTDGGLFLGTFLPDMSAPRRAVARTAFPVIRRKLQSDFGITQKSVDAAFERVREVGDRVKGETGPGGYLAGGRFSVADLTLASLISPLAAPVQFPYPQPQRDHEAFAPVRETLAESGLLDWARDMYSEHRPKSAEVRP